ncbi:ABC transporter ATP-binding protein [uncultured Micrococcus sp.]|uniref:ABC transporter ATP-binding protein n=1 Tax=uncultured Micrococcus sp. TaxID=114051 RepID=UPI002591F5B2|nr:ATP-binding cassette domain-containing protein [uncultured Micrococcus sp.]
MSTAETTAAQPADARRTPSPNTGAEIRLEGLTKRYPGQKEPAVDALDLTIPAGQTVMFVGPSGCGKTTSLKMINRLVEPSGGRILIDGEDITHKNPTRLRRHIGYVIQGGGMMPHMSVAENIGLVPGLLKWDSARTRERVDELLDMVGLDPSVYRDRYPRELSGGQQQRVGVARGLAADPPVLLMDEPFGAVDPITRQRLQDEMLDIQDRLHKTIVMVTHDVDEALKLGDRILILEPGARIAQYDTPEAILTAPANDFVADFVGSGAMLKRLSLVRVGDLRLDQPPTCRVGESAEQVCARVEEAGADAVVVLDERGRPLDWVFLRQLRGVAAVQRPRLEATSVVDHRSTLHDALDAILTSSHSGAMVTRQGQYIGVIQYDTVTEHTTAWTAQARAAEIDALDAEAPGAGPSRAGEGR